MLSVAWADFDERLLLQMSPDDYAGWSKRISAERHRDLVTGIPGLVCEIVDDMCVLVVTDRQALADYLVERDGMDPLLAALQARILSEGATHTAAVQSVRSVIRDVADGILQWGSPRLDRVKFVPIDVIASPMFDAGAGPVPSGGDVVLFGEGVLYLPTWLNIWQACKWGEGDQAGFEAHQARTYLPKLAQTACTAAPPQSTLELMDAFLLSGRIGWNEVVITHVALSHCLQFLLLHEFAHIVLGHTDKLREWSQSRPKIAELRRRWAEQRELEHEADAFAVHSMPPPALHEDGSPAFEMLMPALTALFAFFHLSKSAEAADVERETHPAAPEHLLRILEPLTGAALAEREAEFVRGLPESCTWE
jgi:hypothetical protein